jgi:hypothetical protein
MPGRGGNEPAIALPRVGSSPYSRQGSVSSRLPRRVNRMGRNPVKYPSGGTPRRRSDIWRSDKARQKCWTVPGSSNIACCCMRRRFPTKGSEGRRRSWYGSCSGLSIGERVTRRRDLLRLPANACPVCSQETEQGGKMGANGCGALKARLAQGCPFNFRCVRSQFYRHARVR